ncbi:MAG: HPr family phosphocarrier protein [Planctomycetes bacterium]|nr:HPr family phosphocarrier protein [Planctomycetota bacterium]
MRSTIKVRLINEKGLHARPSHALVTCALGFACDIRVRSRSQEVNGKSILELMTLAAAFGHELEFIAEGDGAEDAVRALAALVNAGFDE